MVSFTSLVVGESIIGVESYGKGGNTVFGVFWPCPPMLYNRRSASLSFFIFSEKILELLIQFSRRCKEEV
jgi:hypothetical protein